MWEIRIEIKIDFEQNIGMKGMKKLNGMMISMMKLMIMATTIMVGEGYRPPRGRGPRARRDRRNFRFGDHWDRDGNDVRVNRNTASIKMKFHHFMERITQMFIWNGRDRWS